MLLCTFLLDKMGGKNCQSNNSCSLSCKCFCCAHALQFSLLSICVYRYRYCRQVSLFFFWGFYCAAPAGWANHSPLGLFCPQLPSNFPLFNSTSVNLSFSLPPLVLLEYECPPSPCLFETACSYIIVFPYRISSLFLSPPSLSPSFSRSLITPSPSPPAGGGVEKSNTC